ncbi:MAG TPA: hypothetical protein VFP80_05145 [Thermoanaerobaculia bacterium]|nr:hypothetical protein [Thermoanaerobaculia bacterium]
MAALVDSNVLVYRVDARDRRKQKIATDLLRRGLGDGSIVIPHQALVEFCSSPRTFNMTGGTERSGSSTPS